MEIVQPEGITFVKYLPVTGKERYTTTDGVDTIEVWIRITDGVVYSDIYAYIED